MTAYFAVVYEEKDIFGAAFPDFPGCITSADSLKELGAMAREALEFHIEGMRRDNLPIPEPSSAKDIAAQPEYAGLPIVAVVV